MSGLRCEDLTVALGGREILRGVDLEVPAGTRTALVGPSGAGKTTLLRAVCGLAPVAGGAIRIGDRRIDALPAHRRRCAVVFQEPRLLPHLDVRDNVAFALRAERVPRAERRARAAGLLDAVGLGEHGGRDVAGLSGGEQQRVALARALCADPELLILDEPLAALDPNRREDLRRLVVALQEERGVTTLVITHDRAEAAELGQRVALLLDGRVAQDDEPEALFRRPASDAVARFVGANVLRGAVRGGALVVGEGRLPVPGGDVGDAAVAVRPEDVRIDDDAPLRMTVAESTFTGTHVRLVLREGDASLTAVVPPSGAPVAGARVGVGVADGGAWRIPVDGADGAAAGPAAAGPDAARGA